MAHSPFDMREAEHLVAEMRSLAGAMLPILHATNDPMAAWGAGLAWVFVQSFVLMAGGFLAPVVRKIDRLLMPGRDAPDLVAPGPAPAEPAIKPANPAPEAPIARHSPETPLPGTTAAPASAAGARP